MSSGVAGGDNAWVDAFSIVTDSNSKLLLVVPDFHFDLRGLCVPDRIPHCFCRNAENFVPYHWVQISQCSFHLNAKFRGNLVRWAAEKFLAKISYRLGQILSRRSPRTQRVDGVSAFGDRIRCLFDGVIDSLFGLFRARRKEVGYGQEPNHCSVKTLQQRVVQLSCDPSPFLHTCIESRIKFPIEFSEAYEID